MPTTNIRSKKLYYQDIGEGYPLLFGHSYLWTSNMWKPQLERLSKHFRCIATDLWDHGQSDHLGEEDYSLEQCADDHFELMKMLGIDEFAMIGLSVGGMWGTHLALRYPEAISHLVLMDTFVGSEPKVTLDKYFAMIDSFESAGCFSPAFVDSVVPLFFSPHTLENKKDMVKAFHDSLCNVKPDQIPGIAKLGRIIFSRADLISRLQEITQPSLVIVGKVWFCLHEVDSWFLASRRQHFEIRGCRSGTFLVPSPIIAITSLHRRRPKGARCEPPNSHRMGFFVTSWGETMALA